MALDRLALPRAASNLLVVAVPRDEGFAQSCNHLLAALIPTVSCHTVAWDPEFARVHGASAMQAIPRELRLRIFFDILTPAALGHMEAGDGEVRIVVWTENCVADLWDRLQLSLAQLEIFVLPVDLPHPHHPGRRLIDTTPYVPARDLLQLLNP
jgi:hypothetical protein